MTTEERDKLFKEFESFLETMDISPDDFLMEWGRLIKENIHKQQHPAVKACLEACSEELRHAGYNLYASTK